MYKNFKSWWSPIYPPLSLVLLLMFLVSYIRNLALPSRVAMNFSMFSSRSLMALEFTFKSMIHLNYFLYTVWGMVQSSFLEVYRYQNVTVPIVKKTILSEWNLLCALLDIKRSSMCNLISWLSTKFQWSVYVYVSKILSEL